MSGMYILRIFIHGIKPVKVLIETNGLGFQGFFAYRIPQCFFHKETACPAAIEYKSRSSPCQYTALCIIQISDHLSFQHNRQHTSTRNLAKKHQRSGCSAFPLY